MTQTFVKFGTVIFAIIAIVFLVATYVINGSEKEDAWLYIFSIWLVIYSAIIAFPKKKK